MASQDDQKIDFAAPQDTNTIFDKKKVRANPKRIQSLQHVIHGLGLNTQNYVITTEEKLKEETKSQEDRLDPCQEIDDEICDKILNHQDISSGVNSLGSVSEKSPEKSTRLISWKKLTDEQFSEILNILATDVAK